MCELNNQVKMPQVGHCYLHFKGKIYIVESIGRDTTTGELRVTYIEAHKALDPNAIRHHRKLSEWFEIVNRPENGHYGKRFTETHLRAERYVYGLKYDTLADAPKIP